MNPEEKAKELVEKFKAHTQQFNESKGWYEDIEAAKACALICVSELISDWRQYKGMYEQGIFDSELTYWVEVRESIQKL